MTDERVKELTEFYADRYDIQQLQSKVAIAEERLRIGFETEAVESLHKVMLSCMKRALASKIH